MLDWKKHKLESRTIDPGINPGEISITSDMQMTPKTHVLFIKGDYNANGGGQEIPGITGKFGLGV